jgi:hypothetical protein
MAQQFPANTPLAGFRAYTDIKQVGLTDGNTENAIRLDNTSPTTYPAAVACLQAIAKNRPCPGMRITLTFDFNDLRQVIVLHWPNIKGRFF